MRTCIASISTSVMGAGEERNILARKGIHGQLSLNLRAIEQRPINPLILGSSLGKAVTFPVTCWAP